MESLLWTKALCMSACECTCTCEGQISENSCLECSSSIEIIYGIMSLLKSITTVWTPKNKALKVQRARQKKKMKYSHTTQTLYVLACEPCTGHLAKVTSNISTCLSWRLYLSKASKPDKYHTICAIIPERDMT